MVNLKTSEIDQLINLALSEDQSRHDVTSQFFVKNNKKATAYIIAKEPAIVCGMNVAKALFQKLDKKLRFSILCKDGTAVKKGTKLALIKGQAKTILAGERSALNFIGHLSGIATKTNHFVKAIRSKEAKIFDTRKTTPGLRRLQKYAVACGGGFNHRMNLNDLIMIKDNHRELYQNTESLVESIKTVRKKTKKPIELEVDNLTEFQTALKAKPDMILLDNMKPAQLKKAVRLNKENNSKRRPLLEASGGITFKNVKQYAQTGVDRISIGELTHSIKSIDVSMELIK